MTVSKVIRVCFLGTPEFAAIHLESVLKNKNYQVVGVVTQPDRPAGRKMQLTPSAVKTLALQHGIPILTPENLRKEPGNLSVIRSWKADLAIVVAFGQILSQEFLDSFSFGAVNVHGSLLPLWRGAAPIQRSLEAGDQVTGVSLQKVVRKLDAGAVIGERKIALDDKINATELYGKLAPLGCELLNVELLDFLRGEIRPVEQDETKVTLAAKLEKEEGLLDAALPARRLHNKVRAFSMGPGTYFRFQGKRLKIHTTKVVDEKFAGTPFRIHDVDTSKLVVETSLGLLSLIEVQPESKSRMVVEDFLKSLALKKGDLLV